MSWAILKGSIYIKTLSALASLTGGLDFQLTIQMWEGTNRIRSDLRYRVYCRLRLIWFGFARICEWKDILCRGPAKRVRSWLVGEYAFVSTRCERLPAPKLEHRSLAKDIGLCVLLSRHAHNTICPRTCPRTNTMRHFSGIFSH